MFYCFALSNNVGSYCPSYCAVPGRSNISNRLAILIYFAIPNVLHFCHNKYTARSVYFGLELRVEKKLDFLVVDMAFWFYNHIVPCRHINITLGIKIVDDFIMANLLVILFCNLWTKTRFTLAFLDFGDMTKNLVVSVGRHCECI